MYEFAENTWISRDTNECGVIFVEVAHYDRLFYPLYLLCAVSMAVWTNTVCISFVIRISLMRIDAMPKSSKAIQQIGQPTVRISGFGAHGRPREAFIENHRLFK